MGVQVSAAGGGAPFQNHIPVDGALAVSKGTLVGTVGAKVTHQTRSTLTEQWLPDQVLFCAEVDPRQGRVGGAPSQLRPPPEQEHLIKMLGKKVLCWKEEILKPLELGAVSFALGRRQHRAV